MTNLYRKWAGLIAEEYFEMGLTHGLILAYKHRTIDLGLH